MRDETLLSTRAGMQRPTGTRGALLSRAVPPRGVAAGRQRRGAMGPVHQGAKRAPAATTAPLPAPRLRARPRSRGPLAPDAPRRAPRTPSPGAPAGQPDKYSHRGDGRSGCRRAREVALRLLRLLSERGDRALGLIRNPDQASDLEAVGAMPVGADLENLDPDAIATSITGCDAVVFAAGAGPGSGPARKRTVDYGGAVKLIDACKSAGIRRYLMVSAMGVRDPAARGPEMQPLLRGEARGRRGARRQRPRLHDRPPRPAHRRAGHRADRGGRAARADRRHPPRRRRRHPGRVPGRRQHDRQVVRPARGQATIAEALDAL